MTTASPRPGLRPHEFWQRIDPAGTHDPAPLQGWTDAFPACLPDGRQLLLPIRVLPGDGTRAVASLIVNQASFAVQDALTTGLAEPAVASAADVVVGVPTLGLPLAAGVARTLGHDRMVALGTSRKFWYDDDLAEPLSSITSPAHRRTLYLDPRMLPLLDGRRVAVVDDVVSTGTSMTAVLRLLAKAGVEPVAVLAAMLQGPGWRTVLSRHGVSPQAPLRSPLLTRSAGGRWRPEPADGE